MGVLEDAIREHLELKRQHGASEEEVERQETEVLGQAQRQAAEDEAGEEAAQAPGEELPAGEEPAGAEPFDEAPADLAEPPEPPFEEAPGDAGRETDIVESEAPLGADPGSVAEEPFDHAMEEDEPPPRALADDPPGDETVTFEDFVEFDELEPGSAPPMPAHGGEQTATPGAGGDDPESEDVLEETPEFLQETPEHDRLWFEQKPPRDFDFD